MLDHLSIAIGFSGVLFIKGAIQSLTSVNADSKTTCRMEQRKLEAFELEASGYHDDIGVGSEVKLTLVKGC